MLRENFVWLSILAFATILGGFIVRGAGRSLFGGQTGDLLAAPLIIGGFALIVILTLASILAYLGIGSLADVLGNNS